MADSWFLIASHSARASLAPLIEAHAATRPVCVFSEAEDWRASLDGAAGVLIVSGTRANPRDLLPDLFLQTSSGRRVPAGCLPQANEQALRCFAACAAEIQRRPRGPVSVALLGQWDDEVLRTVARTAELLAASEDLRIHNWTADRIVRRDLLNALRLGPALALYFGHGRAYGWSGYHGLHIRHLPHAAGRPLGAIVSLTCNTAARGRGGRYSFAERVVLTGIAAASLGAIEPTRTVPNWRWGLGLCRELALNPYRPIGELLVTSGAAVPGNGGGSGAYRLIGDPLARLAPAEGALEECGHVLRPAPLHYVFGEEWRAPAAVP